MAAILNSLKSEEIGSSDLTVYAANNSMQKQFDEPVMPEIPKGIKNIILTFSCIVLKV